MTVDALKANKRRCVFETAGADNLAAAQIVEAASHCAALSRNVTPLLVEGCQPLGAWHCAAGLSHYQPQIRGGSHCIEYFNRFLAQQGLHYGTAPRVTETRPVNHSNAQILLDTCLQRPSKEVEASSQKRVNTPSFIGNQSHGWDALFARLAAAIQPSELPITSGQQLNLVLGYEHFAANYRIMQQLLNGFGYKIQLLSNASDFLTTPEDNQYSNDTSSSPTSLADWHTAPTAEETLLVRPWQLPRSRQVMRDRWGHSCYPLPIPMGLAWSDTWLNHMAQLSEQEVPPMLAMQRYQLCEAIHEALPWICGTRFAIVGEPDFTLGITRYLIELGAGPALILCQNGDEHWHSAITGLLTDCEYREGVPIHIGSLPTDWIDILSGCGANFLITPPLLTSPSALDELLPSTMQRINIENPAAPGDEPSTLAYEGARHLLNVIVRALQSHGA